MYFVNGKFSYRGIDSDQMGVMLVSLNSGMTKRTFGIKKNINVEKIRNNDVPIHYNTEKQTYPIPITIKKIDDEEPWTTEDELNISEWLFADDEFHEFISEDYPDLIFQLQFVSGEISYNPLKFGYLELQTEMKTPYPYTRTSLAEYDLYDNTSTEIIEIENRSNVLDYYYPTFEVELLDGATSFKIKNLTSGGEETIFSNLTANEVICVDNLNQQIASSTGLSRVDNFNMKFLRLVKGVNRLQITGKCKITFKCSFPIMI